MELSYHAISLLRHVVSFTGEKENNKEGEETECRRRLNVDESVLRQMFFSETNEKVKQVEKGVADLVKTHNASIAKQELTEEQKEQIVADFNEKYTNIITQSFALSLSDKTKVFLKKYFDVYGEDVGFIDGDGTSVKEISEKL